MSDKHKNILFITNVVGPFLHHRQHLVDAAMREGFRPIIMAMQDSSLKDEFTFEFHPVSLKLFKFNLFGDTWFFLKIMYLLLRKQPDVLHMVTIKPYLYGGLASRLVRILGWRGKTVITVAGLGRLFSPERTASTKGRILQKFIHPFMVLATKHAIVFFETQHDRKFWLDKGIIQNHQSRVTNGTGIDLELFKQTPSPPNNGKLKMLFAGRLIRSKGLDVLMLAAKRLERVQNIEFYVAGEANPEDDDCVLPDELTSYPNITYLGVVVDMPGLLSDTNVVVLPSRYNEGIPRIMIEGAAMGCVLVATEFPGSIALIQESETGFFIRGNSIEKQADHLSEIILKLHSDDTLFQKIGKTASNFIKYNKFGIYDVQKQFLDVYTSRDRGAFKKATNDALK